MSQDVRAVRYGDRLEAVRESMYVTVYLVRYPGRAASHVPRWNHITENGGKGYISHSLSEIREAVRLHKPILLVQEIGTEAPPEVWRVKDVLIRARKGDFLNPSMMRKKLGEAGQLLEAIRKQRVEAGLITEVEKLEEAKEVYIG